MKQKIIILGAGFAGLRLARMLAKSDFNVQLIDKTNHHQFQPLFYQVATANLEPSSISFPIRKVFQHTPNVRITMAEVSYIDEIAKKVDTNVGSFEFDILVIAIGADTNFFGNKDLERLAFPMKSTVEAINLRQHILVNFEEATLATDDRKKELFNIVIAGGGATGVELAGALSEMKKNILPRDYPEFDHKLINIILVEGGHATLSPMSEESQKTSQAYLEQMGVKILLNTRVTSFDGKTVELSNNEKIPTNTLIWAAGIKGNDIKGLEKAQFERGNRIVVNRFCQVEGSKDIYAIGDIACMKTEKYPNGHPQVANVATSQAKYLGQYFASNFSTQSEPFEYKDRGSMATVGKNKAVVDLPWWSFQGFFAWLVWMMLHVLLLMGMKNRMQVFMNWVYAYFTNDSSLRLIFKNLYKRKSTE